MSAPGGDARDFALSAAAAGAGGEDAEGSTPPGQHNMGPPAESGSDTPSPHSAATDGDDGDDASGYWLLCAVICSGKGLYVGEGQLGDVFCMLHTSDGVCRSRTVSQRKRHME
jgi:hypothetical protein